MDAWSLMRGDAFIHFVSGSRRVNIRLGVLLLIPKSPQTSRSVTVSELDCKRFHFFLGTSYSWSCITATKSSSPSNSTRGKIPLLGQTATPKSSQNLFSPILESVHLSRIVPGADSCRNAANSNSSRSPNQVIPTAG